MLALVERAAGHAICVVEVADAGPGHVLGCSPDLGSIDAVARTGTRVAFRAGGRVGWMDVRDRALHWVVERGAYGDPAWSPDGRVRTLVLDPMDAAAVRTCTPEGACEDRALGERAAVPAWHADLLAWCGPSGVRVLDLASDGAPVSAWAEPTVASLAFASDGALWARAADGRAARGRATLEPFAEGVDALVVGVDAVVVAFTGGGWTRVGLDGEGAAPMEGAGTPVWVGAAVWGWTPPPRGLPVIGADPLGVASGRVVPPTGAASPALDPPVAWGARAVWRAVVDGRVVVRDAAGVVARLDGDVARIW